MNTVGGRVQRPVENDREIRFRSYGSKRLACARCWNPGYCFLYKWYILFLVDILSPSHDSTPTSVTLFPSGTAHTVFP